LAEAVAEHEEPEMKTIMRLLPVCIFLLGTSQIVAAQETPPLNSDRVRDTIQQLEKTELSSRSATVQDLYRRSLLRLYADFDLTLQRDISDLEKIQSMVAGMQSEITTKIDELRLERAANAEKLKTLQGDLQSAGSATGASVSVPATATPVRTAASIVAPPETASSTAAGSTSNTPAGADVAEVTSKGEQTTNTATAAVACSTGNNYTDAPELVSSEVDKLVANVVKNNNDPSRITQNYLEVFLYSVADAVIPRGEDSDRALRALKAYRYLGETARTDKQIGASAKSPGSTSAIEKAGFARLLGLAVERGAILQDVNSTSLTLSSSPYVLYTFNNGGDTAENYQRAGFLNRVGVSATFNMGNTASSPLLNARRNQLTEWSARVRLYGDRSPRSRGFEEFWDAEIRPLIQTRLSVIGSNLNFIGATPELKKLKDKDQKEFRALFTKRIAEADYAAAVKAGDQQKQKQLLKDFVMCYLKQAVVDPIREGRVQLSSEIRTQLGDNFIRDLGQSLAGLEAVRKRLNERLDDLAKSPLATLAYTNHRVTNGSDYSELKVIYEQDQSIFRLLKLVGNVGLSFYNKPNPAMNQDRVRDFSASVSLEGKTESPFLRNSPDLSRITYAFTGSFERMPENRGMTGRKHNLAAAQFRIEIPITAGVSLPFAVTYANGTEQSNKAHVRGNFGFSFDVDKLLAITRLLQQQ